MHDWLDIQNAYRRLGCKRFKIAADNIPFGKLQKFYKHPVPHEVSFNYSDQLDLWDVMFGMIRKIEELEAEIARLVEPHVP